MADLRNCNRCGKLHNFIGGSLLCPSCRDEDEADFQKIKRYLYENPGATILQVSKDLDINIDKIKRFLKDERLEIIGDEGIPVLECEKCGKPISTGRFCDTCSRELAADFTSAARDIQKANNMAEYGTGRGLRYLSREKDWEKQGGFTSNKAPYQRNKKKEI
ncbi:MAG TPA: MerR family transcriptional regulator [Clostridiales bacterium]|nr:MerR family transcriptional regulator [Clostridiales bacterium]